MGPMANQIGFGLVIVLCLNYFFQDLLKRRIRLDDDCIYFGFQRIRIDEIASVDVDYKKRKLLPGSLILTTTSGQSLKFSINGLTEENVKLLLKHLQARNSRLETAPVISTLVKCRKTLQKPPLDTKERLIVRYNCQQFLDDSIETFILTARNWMRVGPLVMSIVFVPFWMMYLSSLYVCLQANSFRMVQQLNLNSFIGKLLGSVQTQILTEASELTGKSMYATTNPVVAVLAGSLLLGFLFYVQYILLRPNSLVADEIGITFQLRRGLLAIPMGRVRWSEVLSAKLYRPRKDASADAWKMRLTKTDGKKFDVSLAALTAEDKSRVLKRMEKQVPNCEIEAELSQSMLPKAERSYTEIWLQSLSQAPERKTLEPLMPGQTVGEDRFEVLKTLGVGGQGTAYLCRILTGKEAETIVLKETILPIFVDEAIRRSALQRFEQEARMLQSIASDNVVKLVDYFIEDHRAYLVLEHIDGAPLRDTIASKGALSEERVYDLALQMCDLLKLLHLNSIVHRDFTPDNLILNSKGKLKLIDFNVAQQIQEGATGTIVGKHAYVPPEQFRGKATAQSDIYAFGATLFYLLTGEDPEPISQSIPSQRNPHVSATFDVLVKRATALQTNKRFATADELEVALLSMELAPPAEPLEDNASLTAKARSKDARLIENG
ncbi:MAG: hypothetical protein C0507_00160 [Cyanobacteria bacterium PR.3.49]|nr:hypothetical protein [Cyanobacteria bacterium PR.3.49]